MDAFASASHRTDAEVNDLYAFFLKIENTEFPTPFKQRSTVIKYTKLPEFDLESKGSCRQKCYSLEPRLRRIITLEEPAIKSSRSFKLADPICYSKVMATSLNKRKIVTISEDDEYDLHPKFSKDFKKSSNLPSNRSAGTEHKNEGKLLSQRTTSRLMKPTKYIKETKSSAKKNNDYVRKDVGKSSNSKTKLLNNDHGSLDSIRSRNPKDKDAARRIKSVALSKTSLSRNYVSPNENERELFLIKAKLYDNSKCNTSAKKCIEKNQSRTHNLITGKRKESYLVETPGHKVVPVIHVPLDEKYRKQTEILSNAVKPAIMLLAKPGDTVDTEIIVRKNVSTGTEVEPLVKTVDQITDMESIQSEIIYKCADVQTDLMHDTFDKLDIPNVSLKKDKSEHKEELSDLHAQSLPNLKIPRVQISDNRHNEKIALDTQNCNSSSYIISRATLTYTSKQKINFQVVGSNDNQYSNQSPSPLKYPLNIVSVFKKEMSSKDGRNNDSTLQEYTNKSDSSKEYKNCINEIKSLNCSYIPNSNKLMKPSDIISTIRVDNSLLKSVYLCEQFQRELNFIDSFFESLQYLENCSNSERCTKNEKIQRLLHNTELLDPEIVKNSEYDNFLSTLDNGTNSEDSETMASKNLFLLNILIRDEQRRAKNLLSVLKRREDALKDFTKSQILYLENKKKQDNTDITVLKKKQRGALLKLQHECGEMQRMRKALLALSEKRKLALMKTKKDLELKLNNNVDVEQIILGKKKLKRNTTVDRTSVPLKCFDLSSSGCEDSTTSRSTPEDAASDAVAPMIFEPVTSAEKSIQTCDTILEPTSNDAAAENFVVVDGGYLNILFHNLSLPQIFSGGKHYEVNEVALKNIVDSTNTVYSDNWGEFMEKLMEQAKNDEDKSSTPSTARSLVEEFEQYYRTFAEEDKMQQVDEYEVASKEQVPPSVGCETSKATTQDVSCKIESCGSQNIRCVETTAETVVANEASLKIATVDETCECNLLLPDIDTEPVTTVTGPLPVPPGASDVSSITTFSDGSASSEPPQCVQAPSASSLAEPAHEEAEELRRQQLAIEREIKELEQQQCRLLVVREIPDKPPPPYTPPAEARSPKQLTRFRPDGVNLDKIRKYIIEAETPSHDHTDAFEVLVQDFCQDTRDRLKSETNDKPWEPCNLLPEKTHFDPEEVVKAASTELVEVLTAVTPSIMSNVSSRRSDHIDDILFAEWRRVEPEWTSLQSDEVQVKNQVFETIFQRILTETVDEYKRTVLSPVPG